MATNSDQSSRRSQRMKPTPTPTFQSMQEKDAAAVVAATATSTNRNIRGQASIFSIRRSKERMPICAIGCLMVVKDGWVRFEI